MEIDPSFVIERIFVWTVMPIGRFITVASFDGIDTTARLL